MIDEFHARLGVNLKAARLNQDLTVVDAADAVGLNRTTIASYERGDRRISVEDLTRLAALYWKPLQELIPHELAWETAVTEERGTEKPEGIWECVKS